MTKLALSKTSFYAAYSSLTVKTQNFNSLCTKPFSQDSISFINEEKIFKKKLKIKKKTKHTYSWISFCF